MATKAEIAVRVLQRLMVLENGESIDPADQLIIEQAYDSAYGLLEHDNLVTWGSTDDIPVSAELPIIDYVANRAMGSFTVRQDISIKMPQEALQAVRDLFSLTQGDYVPDATYSQAY